MTRVIGLTGGIASGKSTVARLLRDLGAPVVDADQLARAVVAPGSPALAEIREHFGDGVIDRDGGLDRKSLAAIVFADAEARRRLESITHPRIAAASQAEIAALADLGHEVIFYEAALIVENRLHERLDGLVVVAVPDEVQERRLMEREHCDASAARARIAAQLPLAAKVAEADWVIDNSHGLDDTRHQVESLWNELRADEEARS